MYAALSLVVFVCLTATTRADHHHRCHTPNMTGSMSVMNLKGITRGYGAFTYDSMGNKLRFRSNDTYHINTTVDLDLLMFFDEGIFYEIDSKNQSCEKKALQSTMHPLDIPDDAISIGIQTSGSLSLEGEGIKIAIVLGSIHERKGQYAMAVTMGCLPMSSFYFFESSSFLFSILNVETEIKDPDLLVVPSYCLGLPLEETPVGTFNSFISEFM